MSSLSVKMSVSVRLPQQRDDYQYLRHFIDLSPINNLEQVDVVNLQGILLSNNFCFDAQVDT